MNEHTRLRLVDLLHDTMEFLGPYEDVDDGNDRPMPNKAMKLAQECEELLALIEKVAV